MKKLTILLLALALTAFAVPAMAGDVAVTGTYQFDAESRSGQGDVKRAWYDDELRVNINVTQGAVKAFVGLEVSDSESFDGDWAMRSAENNYLSDGSGSYIEDLINDYYVQWATPVEGLSVKIGEYGLNFGRLVVVYADPAAHQIGFTYNKLANVDLGFYLSKMYEIAGDTTQAAADRNDDKDTDAMVLTAGVKGVEFFKKLDFIYITGEDQLLTDGGFGYMGLDTAFAAGPVDLAFEYGSVSEDAAADEPTFMYLEVGFDRLAGFDINLELFDSSEDGDLESPFGAGFFFPYQLYGFDSGQNTALNAVRLIGVSGSYKINDKMSVAGKLLAQGTVKGVASASGDDDPVGTEIDAHFMYKFADNASCKLTYATWSPGDGALTDGDTENAMRARFDFAF